MKIHLTFCAGLKRFLQKEKENESTKEGESAEECYNDIGRAVRRSAQKQVNCFFLYVQSLTHNFQSYVII